MVGPEIPLDGKVRVLVSVRDVLAHLWAPGALPTAHESPVCDVGHSCPLPYGRENCCGMDSKLRNSRQGPRPRAPSGP